MRKSAFVVVAALALTGPTIASAQGFGFSVGADDDGYHDRGEYREYRNGPIEYREHDRGRHRGWDRHDYRHREGVTVIKRRHRDKDWDDDD